MRSPSQKGGGSRKELVKGTGRRKRAQNVKTPGDRPRLFWKEYSPYPKKRSRGDEDKDSGNWERVGNSTSTT